MGKLKEKLLNNLTPEEQNEMFELSAFEYVEYMEKYKHLYDDNGDPIPEDVLEQIANETKKAEAEFYEQSEIDEINDENRLKYSDNDIKHIIEKFNMLNSDDILAELRDIWSKKIGE
jgi:hypothetical protein